MIDTHVHTRLHIHLDGLHAKKVAALGLKK